MVIEDSLLTNDDQNLIESIKNKEKHEFSLKNIKMIVLNSRAFNKDEVIIIEKFQTNPVTKQFINVSGYASLNRSDFYYTEINLYLIRYHGIEIKITKLLTEDIIIYPITITVKGITTLSLNYNKGYIFFLDLLKYFNIYFKDYGIKNQKSYHPFNQINVYSLKQNSHNILKLLFIFHLMIKYKYRKDIIDIIDKNYETDLFEFLIDM